MTCDDYFILMLYYILLYCYISKNFKDRGYGVICCQDDVSGLINCRMIMRVEHFGKDCYAAGSITLHHIFA